MDDVCTVDERRVYKLDIEVRIGKIERLGSFINEPIACGRLLVAITRTFFLCLSLSSWVRSALTTCILGACSVR